jgi:hypothetical protein
METGSASALLETESEGYISKGRTPSSGKDGDLSFVLFRKADTRTIRAPLFSIISLASQFNTIESPACPIVSSNHLLESW